MSELPGWTDGTKPWYTSRSVWSIVAALAVFGLGRAGFEVPFASGELSERLYAVVEPLALLAALLATLRRKQKLTGLPPVTAGDAASKPPAKSDNLDDPGRHFSYAWLALPLLALGLSGCMGLGPYADPRTAYKTNNSQTFQPDEFSIVLNIPPNFEGSGPLFAVFAPIGTTGSGAFQGNLQADTAADLGVQSDSSRSTMARTGQQTLGSGEGAATGAPISPAYTETKPVSLDIKPSVAVAVPGVAQSQAQPQDSSQQVIPRGEAGTALPVYAPAAVQYAVPASVADAEARRAQILTDMAALSAGDYTPEKGRQLTAKSAELDFLAAWIAAQTR